MNKRRLDTISIRWNIIRDKAGVVLNDAETAELVEKSSRFEMKILSNNFIERILISAHECGIR